MSIKTILAASIAAISLASSVQAEEIIHITGSTAFRSAVTSSIENLMGAGNFKAAFLQVTSGTLKTEKNADYSIFSGTISSIPVTIKCTWTGSVGGIITLTKNADITQVPTNGWMAKSNLPASNGILGVTAPSYASDSEPQLLKADVTMSDSLQSSTGYSAPILGVPTIAAADPAVSVPGQCGVIVFDWVANNGSPATLTNLNNLQIRALLAGGVFLSQLTGAASDYHTTGSPDFTPTGPVVYVAGRNFDSGTRLSQFAESGFGIQSLPQQVQLKTTGSGGAATVNHVNLYPTDTLFPGQPFQLTYGVGESGYASGGTLAGLLATPGSNGAGADGAAPLYEDAYGIAGGHIVAYLGRSDAATAISTSTFSGNTARILTYNGVADTDANVQQGLYQGWEYEYMYKTVRTGTGALNADKNTVINAIYNRILKFDASASGIFIDNMQVSKPVEGGLITHL